MTISVEENTKKLLKRKATQYDGTNLDKNGPSFQDKKHQVEIGTIRGKYHLLIPFIKARIHLKITDILDVSYLPHEKREKKELTCESMY